LLADLPGSGCGMIRELGSPTLYVPLLIAPE
jgi:hypothetical protein